MMNLVYYQPWSLMDRWRHEIDELSRPEFGRVASRSKR